MGSPFLGAGFGLRTRAGRAADPVPGHTGSAARRHLIASDEHDAWDELPEIEAETLILHGDADRLTPVRNAELLAERTPNARLHVFPGVRHAHFHEARATQSELVTAFLGE